MEESSKEKFNLFGITQAEKGLKVPPVSSGADFSIQIRYRSPRELRRMRERMLRKQLRQAKKQGF
jgi:hypothetical protein